MTGHVWRFVGNLQAQQGRECRAAATVQHGLSIFGVAIEMGRRRVNRRIVVVLGDSGT